MDFHQFPKENHFQKGNELQKETNFRIVLLYEQKI